MGDARVLPGKRRAPERPAALPRGASTPSHVLKFARVRGMTEPFDREERGVEAVAAAGQVVGARAPQYLGRFKVDGYHAAAETAAVGTRLSAYLRRPLPRAAKLRAVEPVARWLVTVARDTAGEPRALVDGLPPVPTTFQHGDLAEENVVVGRRGRFTVLDWEWARTDGLPFADLVYFGVHVLRIVDGVGEDGRERHLVDLLGGRAASSPVLLAWVGSSRRLSTCLWTLWGPLSRRRGSPGRA